jgi:hypothetical protein
MTILYLQKISAKTENKLAPAATNELPSEAAELEEELLPAHH